MHVRYGTDTAFIPTVMAVSERPFAEPRGASVMTDVDPLTFAVVVAAVALAVWHVWRDAD